MVMIAGSANFQTSAFGVDEPESNLDMKNQLRILDAIERASREMNTACLINTHFPNHALNISDQTLMLGLGQKKLFGATKDLLNEENIERSSFLYVPKLFLFKQMARNTRPFFLTVLLLTAEEVE